MNIKELRKIRRLSQKEVGIRVNITQQYYSKIEKGDINGIPINLIKKMSKVFEVTSCEMFEILLESE